MANLYYAPTADFVTTTLNGTVTSGVTTITLNSTANLNFPGIVIIDRQDGNGNNTPAAREVVSYTGISGSNLTGCTRGADGGTPLAHNNNALVETMPTVGMWNSLVSASATVFTADGIVNAIISPVSISQAQITKGFISTLTIVTLINASGASVVGSFGGTGGFTGVFQVPGSLASIPNVGGRLIAPAAYTGQFMTMYVQTAASIASIGIQINKNGALYAIGGILGGATFGSSASIGTAAIAAGDSFTMDINSNASLASDLSVILRGT